MLARYPYNYGSSKHPMRRVGQSTNSSPDVWDQTHNSADSSPPTSLMYWRGEACLSLRAIGRPICEAEERGMTTSRLAMER